MPIKNNREYRDMVIEVHLNEEGEEERKIVQGYASTFNEPYTLFEDNTLVYREQVDANAFDNTDMSDVIMQYNHEGRVFARISNNTLTVTPDERGLFIEADLSGTEIGRELYEEIKGGYTNKMSFGFVVDDDDEARTNLEDGRVEYLRTIRGVSKLYDVSAVSIPCNDGTYIGVQTRSRIDGAIEEVRAERLEAEELELERRKLAVRAKLLGGKTE